MTTHQGPGTDSAIEETLKSYLVDRLKTEVTFDQDLFESGLVSSMFAMELVVHLEKTFEVSIVGNDLRLANFRSIRSMAALVRGLRDGDGRG
ncbi:acyl carrier protein [Streptomyces iranensis]|uniref:Acyl carrier protein (OzmE) n=1 Tax=Streptomyces iranensis TaxID=576784 RepID=A0A060ZHJ2_9ACTN|nr:acyl carrier protein [Streptomyces iranensis]MBP2061219.1 methoxymalonate biosynthesis acyl carrier protein [Streptomyces iranensis]CDR05505.1 acyl carrier protein (OzmE) [Streptomyces iranensis]